MKHLPPIRSGLRGFTLLESVFAVAIFSLALAVLAGSFHQVLMATERIRLEERSSIGTRLLRDTVLSLPTREAVEEGGEVSLPDGTRLEWRGRVDAAEVTGTVVLEINLTQTPADWAELPEQFQYILYRPSWLEAGEREDQFARREDRLRSARPDRIQVEFGRARNP